MAFLDNSGDIILDAVLTDTGRMRLAKGDGRFRITKFAFGDDEINYGLYNKNHPSGSAYYDLDILQSPVLEAFTNNTSVLKYQLMSNMRTDLLFLPVLLVNTNINDFYSSLNSYLVASDTSTVTEVSTTTNLYIDGVNPLSANGYGVILDQGLNSDQTDKTVSLSTLDRSLYETQYSIQLNSKLATLTTTTGELVQPSSIDDDGFATYIVSSAAFVSPIQVGDVNNTNAGSNTVLDGTRGSRVTFKLRVTPQLQTSTYLFTTLGGTSTSLVGSTNFYYIDSSVVVKGLTTGVSTTVPLKFIKKV